MPPTLNGHAPSLPATRTPEGLEGAPPVHPGISPDWGSRGTQAKYVAPRTEPTGGLTLPQRTAITDHLHAGGSVPSAASAAGVGVVVVWAWLFDVLDLDRRISPLVV